MFSIRVLAASAATVAAALGIVACSSAPAPAAKPAPTVTVTKDATPPVQASSQLQGAPTSIPKLTADRMCAAIKELAPEPTSTQPSNANSDCTAEVGYSSVTLQVLYSTPSAAKVTFGALCKTDSPVVKPTPWACYMPFTSANGLGDDFDATWLIGDAVVDLRVLGSNHAPSLRNVATAITATDRVLRVK